jgi:hypothetical protein
MSAGGLSYSGLVNHGKVTLPSVEIWGKNTNIVREPPKSITTRRINKVGQTTSINETIEESGSRTSEAINVYARGVNPFVSVSYNNYSNNGGQSSSIANGPAKSAKLPHRIMREGAFTYPIFYQEDLLPLSRMPRKATSASSNVGISDFCEKIVKQGTAEETKEVKNNLLKVNVKPSAVYKIETPLTQPSEVKHAIQPSIKSSVSSGIRSMDIEHKHTGIPTKEIDPSPLHAMAQAQFTSVRHVDSNTFHGDRYLQDIVSQPVSSNISFNKFSSMDDNTFHGDRYLQDIVSQPVSSNISFNKFSSMDDNTFHGDRYLQEIVSQPVSSNISFNKFSSMDDNTFHGDPYLQNTLLHSITTNVSSIKHTPSGDTMDMKYLPIQEQLHVSVVAPASHSGSTKYIHDDIKLTRNIPEHNIRTNIVDKNNYKSIDYDNELDLIRKLPVSSFATNVISAGNTDHGSRDVHLLEKINPGGYSIPGNVPMKGRMQDVILSGETEKAKMNRMISETMSGRFHTPAPFINTFNDKKIYR